MKEKILFLTAYVPNKAAAGEKNTMIMLNDLASCYDVDLIYFKYDWENDYVPERGNVNTKLTIHRDQDCDFPRQRPASAFPRTGRRNDTGIIPQWILLFASNGYTDCCLEKDSRFQRLGYLSSGICN